jgi:hypothetical protein
MYKNISILDGLPTASYQYNKDRKQELSEYMNGQQNFGGFINFTNDNFSVIQICNENFVECDLKNVEKKDIQKIFNQRMIVNGYGYSTYLNSSKLTFEEYPFSIYKFQSRKVDRTYLSFTKNIKVDINNLQKKIVITASNKDNIGRAIFHSGNLSDWKIIYKSYLSTNNNIPSRFSINGLTGCLSFHDIDLHNITVEVENSNCEDAIHFMRATGDVTELTAKKSLYDALDIDFSQLRFKSININEAKNDCIDLSSGNYSIDSMYLDTCGDKAISVGEKAILFNSMINIENSLYGAAAKDSALIVFEEGSIDSISACILAFRKKQEFGAGKVNMKNINCKNKYLFSSKDSLIH